VSEPAAEARALGESTAETTTKRYNTQLGVLLDGGFVVEAGSIRDLSGRTVFGILRIPKGHALPVADGRLPICRDNDIGPPRRVTLVQDSDSGRWLATDGRLGLQGEELVLVDGHTVEIIGGGKSPVFIDSSPFSDGRVTIQDGQPVVEP